MLPFNFVDVAFVAILLAGALRGRKRGLSQELPSLLKWLILFVVCTVLYQPVGVLIADSGVFDLLSGYIMGYLGVALLVFLIFGVVQKRMKPKLEGTDFFGRGEYYLGMGSGCVRFMCAVIMTMALLNARAFTPAEVKQGQKFQEDVYGSFLFPNLHSVQVEVFERSLTGSWINKRLPFLLISPAEPGQREPSSAPRPTATVQSHRNG